MKKKKTQIRSSPNRGFAIVLALSIMSFVLVLLLSLTSIIRVETVNASNQKIQLQAQEAAKLALYVALGDLQKHVGPDQRVTARADIFGNTTLSQHIPWVAVWDTTQPTNDPVFLVSGQTPTPETAARNAVEIYPGYDLDGNGVYTDAHEFAPTEVELVEGGTSNTQIAWWVSDEGVKAPLSVIKSFKKEVDALGPGESYLDYNDVTLRQTPLIHDPVFDFKELFDIASTEENDIKKVEDVAKILQTRGFDLLYDKSDPNEALIKANLLHNTTHSNYFVLSNPNEGGLKKDLSFLKTLDAETITQNELNTLYGANASPLVTPAAVKLVQFRGNPTNDNSDSVIGMQLDEPTVALTETKAAHFSLAPVITEFQLGMLLAAEETTNDNEKVYSAEVKMLYRVYLELWNPYTIPMAIKQPSLGSDQGYGDIKIEIKNLPSFTLTNVDRGETISEKIKDISFIYSNEILSHKTLAPGMVFQIDFPKTSGGEGKVGVFQQSFEPEKYISGTNVDDYSADIIFNSSPIEIIISGTGPSGVDAEFFYASIDGYKNFSLSYESDTNDDGVIKESGSDKDELFFRLHRDLESNGTAGGGGHKILENTSNAFGFYFQMLSAQDVENRLTDISNWLEKFDFRNRSINTDLTSWNIEDAWNQPNPFPYNFNFVTEAPDPQDLEHDDLFSSFEFFYYQPSGSGRKDRIARVFDLPTGEVTDVGAFRALKFRDFNANAIGNSWGGKLNELYDRYFFSTLPDINNGAHTWDTDTPLANEHIIEHSTITQLQDTDTSSSLILKNGFNLNSTNPEAWIKMLSGKQFTPNSLEIKQERANFGSIPEWETITDSLSNAFFNFPHTGVYNQSSGPGSSPYALITQASAGSNSAYTDSFSIDNEEWINNRQYPTFWQNIRELTDAEIKELSGAIVSEIKDYQTNNGHPFLSMADFLNGGFLQTAINSVSSINLRTNDVDAIVPHTAAYLSQATLMNVLGPIGFVRSDTFKIRGYAKVDGIINSNSTSAMCEATVQRIPDTHPNALFGRKFTIIDLQWLTPE